MDIIFGYLKGKRKMKLQEYFNYQSGLKLSDESKIALYQKISEKRVAEQQTLKRASILWKRKVLVLASFAIIFVLFGTFFWDVPEEYRAFWTEKIPS